MQATFEKPHAKTRIVTGRAVAIAPRVTVRSLGLGAVLSVLMAGFNCWIEACYNVHFLGGVPLPLGAIFSLLILVLLVNGTARRLRVRGFSAIELLTMYSMLLMATLISTPGTETFFLTTGAALFYYSTRENGWEKLFYRFVPRHFAPGWDGHTAKMSAINGLYNGHVNPADIPWDAWTPLLIAWGILLLLVYATLFFFSLLLRRQWIENEALAFPLVQLPLQMVEADPGQNPPGRAFWSDKTMWLGFGLVFVVHLFRALNNFYPIWPVVNTFQGYPVWLSFPDAPWNAIGGVKIEIFLGAIGVAYLLTREVAFSFWFFYLVFKLAFVLSYQLGYPPGNLPQDSYQGQPLFLSLQSVGGWGMIAGLLLWSARHHFAQMLRAALRGQSLPDEPFAPRFVMGGFAACCAAILAWCWFSGINPLIAFVFLTLYIVISMVLARLVVEGGFLFPQVTFSPLEFMTTSVLGAPLMGASQITRLSFLQPTLFSDMRANLLPGYLHTLKIAHSLELEPRQTRRLLGGVAIAVVLSLATTCFVAIATLYKVGGLSVYSWFSSAGPQSSFNGAARTITNQTPAQPANWLWIAIGAAVVWLIMLARARFLWFPLHPLGYIVAAGYPITRLWASFFLAWAIKSVALRYGGSDTAAKLKPFMIGLILGNACAMVFWMLFGFWFGSQIPYWPA